METIIIIILVVLVINVITTIYNSYLLSTTVSHSDLVTNYADIPMINRVYAHLAENYVDKNIINQDRVYYTNKIHTLETHFVNMINNKTIPTEYKELVFPGNEKPIKN